MKLVVLGAGAWGTALAVSAASQASSSHQVTLWARDARQAAGMRTSRENVRYLPGIGLPPALDVLGGDLDACFPQVEDADLVIVGTPMVALRAMLTRLNGLAAPVAWLCKGFEAPLPHDAGPGQLGHEICATVAPRMLSGVLSGPSFAQEVAQGQPTALVAASAHASVREALVAAFHSPTLRVYANEDIVGVEVGGAVKNVLAIATGLCDGLIWD
jgi:glycerol-3-phosphate dehydrogenase (NAD(P)+)